MAIRKVVVKLNHVEALIKVINDTSVPASVTIDLDVDLLKSNEELSGTTVKVGISAIDASIETNYDIELVRNSVTIVNLFENTNMLSMAYGADRELDTYDIVVNMTGKGTTYIRLLKESGFRPLIRPEQGVNS